MDYKISCFHFNGLSPSKLYEILRLRSEVFVVEQKCVFLDLDDKDQHCYHVAIHLNGLLIATARLLPPQLYYPEMSIGRIVTHSSVRGKGVGGLLVSKSIDLAHEKFGVGPIRIGAQLYAKNFYESFGFVQTSDVYDEDGIDHIEMIRQ